LLFLERKVVYHIQKWHITLPNTIMGFKMYCFPPCHVSFLKAGDLGCSAL
jgi:hypothetical protein